MLSDKFKSDWPNDFGLVYSVTLSKGSLGTSLQVQNKGSQPFEFQVLLHSYFKVEVCCGHTFFFKPLSAVLQLSAKPLTTPA